MQHHVVRRMHCVHPTSLLILCRSPEEVAAAVLAPNQPITQSKMIQVAGVGWKLRSLALLVCLYQVVQMVLKDIKDGLEIQDGKHKQSRSITIMYSFLFLHINSF